MRSAPPIPYNAAAHTMLSNRRLPPTPGVNDHLGAGQPLSPGWRTIVANTRDAIRQKVRPTPYLVTMSGSFRRFCKALFILRSYYLYAIGLGAIFSLGRDIPAISCCSPNQHYSMYEVNRASTAGYGSITLHARTVTLIR